jgi:hypothetical protein
MAGSTKFKVIIWEKPLQSSMSFTIKEFFLVLFQQVQ